MAATDPRFGEHILLQLALSTPSVGRDSVVVFRTGPTTLRIAKRLIDEAGNPYYENEHYNIHQDVLIPFYAVAENATSRRQAAATHLQPSSSIGIYRGNATGAIDYSFSADTDALNFQRAVTGYQVVFDKSVTWVIKHSGFYAKLARGQGRMQIWYWKPLEGLTTASEQATSPTTSAHSPRSHVSATSNIVVGTLLKRRNTSNITVVEHSTAGSVICATTPPHPVIVIYGKKNEVYTYYHIEMDSGLDISPSACQCEMESNKKTSDQKCERSVIKKRDKKGSTLSFKTRTLSAKKDNLSKWNLGVFAQPRHPFFKSKKTVQEMSSDFMNIDFESVADRVEFNEKFGKALKLRNAAKWECENVISSARRMSERNGCLLPSPRGTSRSDSMYSLPRIPDHPPISQPLSPVPAIGMNEPRSEDTFNANANSDANSDTNGDVGGEIETDSRSSTGSSSRSIGSLSPWRHLY